MKSRCFILFLCLPILLSAAPRYRLSRWGMQAGNYSGITPLGDGLYAVVSDKDVEIPFHIWQIEINLEKGKVKEVKDLTDQTLSLPLQSVSGAQSRDAEGIAFCSQRNTVFVGGEADQRIIEYRLDGVATGYELPIPAQYGSDQIQSNRGFEALGYDEAQQRFWTCTESPVRSALQTEDANRVDLLCFSLGKDKDAESGLFSLDHKVSYPLALPKGKAGGHDYYHGVVAITPLSDGTLLVLEREARITSSGSGSRCWVSLFRFWTQNGQKEKLGEWRSRFNPLNTRFANYEGMCLGPVLNDGSQTLLLVSDSQGRYGKGLWHLKDYLRVVVLPNFR